MSIARQLSEGFAHAHGHARGQVFVPIATPPDRIFIEPNVEVIEGAIQSSDDMMSLRRKAEAIANALLQQMATDAAVERKDKEKSP